MNKNQGFGWSPSQEAKPRVEPNVSGHSGPKTSKEHGQSQTPPMQATIRRKGGKFVIADS